MEISYIEPVSKMVTNDYFLEEFGKEINRIAYLKHPLTVILIEFSYLDKGSQTSEIFFNDLMLRQFGLLVRKNIKQTDLFGRLSDEEFVVALLETNMEKGIITAKNIKKIIEGLSLPIEGKEYKIIASFGIAEYLPQEKDYENLINVQVLD